MQIARVLCSFAVPVLSWSQLSTGTACSNSVCVFYETRLEPPEPEIEKHGAGVLTEKKLIKRHICDFGRENVLRLRSLD